MSYSFIIRADSKVEAADKVAQELDKVIGSQPVHLHDREAAQHAAEAFIDLLADEPAENEAIVVSIHGSLGWRSEGVFTASGFGVSVHLAPKA